MGDVWALLSNTCSDWYEDRAQRLGAALAFYTIFRAIGRRSNGPPHQPQLQ
jgi:uncharacterized BrkB/YihY/UPF0761 family membrane protein